MLGPRPGFSSGFGDCHLGILVIVKSVGSGVSEPRVDYGPGYRVYLTRQGDSVVILLAGGTKKSQSRDIKRAISLAQEL